MIPKAKPWSRPSDSEDSDSIVAAGAQKNASHATDTSSSAPSSQTAVGSEQGQRGQAHAHQPDAHQRQPPAPVRPAAHHGVQQTLDRGGGHEQRADGQPAGSEVVQAQRHQHVQRADGQRRQQHHPHRRCSGRARSATPSSRQLLARWASEPGMASAHRTISVATTPTPENTSSGLVSLAAPPITGPSSTPNSAAPSADPMAWPRRSGGRDAHQPRQGARPRARAAHALDEAGGVQHTDRLGVAEDQAGGGDQRQPGDRRGLGAHAPGQPPGGQRGQQRARRVGRAQQPGGGLRQPQLVLVGGQQRRDGREEHRVHQDGGADEREDTAHPTIDSGGQAR